MYIICATENPTFDDIILRLAKMNGHDAINVPDRDAEGYACEMPDTPIRIIRKVSEDFHKENRHTFEKLLNFLNFNAVLAKHPEASAVNKQVDGFALSLLGITVPQSISLYDSNSNDLSFTEYVTESIIQDTLMVFWENKLPITPADLLGLSISNRFRIKHDPYNTSIIIDGLTYTITKQRQQRFLKVLSHNGVIRKGDEGFSEYDFYKTYSELTKDHPQIKDFIVPNGGEYRIKNHLNE